MYRSTIIAIATLFAVLAGTAHAQISGTIGGDVVACAPLGAPLSGLTGSHQPGGVFARCR